MPLLEHETTVGEAIDDIEETIAELSARREEMEPDTPDAKALARVISDQRRYLRGLRWHCQDNGDDEPWGEETTLVFGPMTAAERALMLREVDADADNHERQLWRVAAATVEAPYYDDDLTDCFVAVGQLHTGFVDWADGKLNALLSPGASEAGNKSLSSFSATDSDQPDAQSSSTS